MYICRGAGVARLRIEKIARIEKNTGRIFQFFQFFQFCQIFHFQSFNFSILQFFEVFLFFSIFH